MKPETKDCQNQYAGSQLSRLRRFLLLITNPRDAFSLLSPSERIDDACWLFAIYFIIKAPAVIQNRIVLGKLEYDQWQVMIGGLIGGVVVTALLLVIIATLVHLLTKQQKKSTEKKFIDALTLPALSLAPQLILIAEIPFILFNFASIDTMTSVTFMRLTASMMTLRTFYWGLRVQFFVSRVWAIASIGLTFSAMLAIAVFLSVSMQG